MSNLQESPVWVDKIYELNDETPVLGKVEGVPGAGPSNLQAEQLANRTQWLKQSLESIPDYREYTFYPTSEDPDGTLAGLAATPDGKMFRVANGAGDNPYSFSFYLNNSGSAELVAVEINGKTLLPLLTLLNFVSYIDDDEFEGSGIDSAGTDTARRWLWKWVADTLWLKQLNVTQSLTARMADILELNAQELKINGIAIKAIDNVDYLPSDEYAGARFNSALVSSDLRWLVGISGDEFFYKRINVRSLISDVIDVRNLLVNGSPVLSYYADAAEFEGGKLASAILDINKKIISGVKDDGQTYTAPDDSFRAFVESDTLKVLDLKTSVMQVFATETDFTHVRNCGTYFIFYSSSSDAVGGEIMCPYNAYIPVSEYGRKTLALWGHSFIGNNTSFSLKLSQLTGYPAYNFGRSGATSVAIALRNGAYTKNYQPAGGVIPAAGDIALTPAQPGPLQIVGDVAAEDGLKCSLAGIDGVINWTGTEMIFTRSESGSAVSVTGPTPLQVYPYTTREIGDIPLATRYDQHRESVNILWIGRNNASSIMQILSDMKAITDRLARQNRRFVVLPEFPMASEVIGTNGQAQVMYLNSELKRLYPGNYCEIDGIDLLQNFKNHYNPDYPQDVEDIANGITPTSLRQDTLHPSQSLRPNALFIGTEVNAVFVHQFMVSNGWL